MILNKNTLIFRILVLILIFAPVLGFLNNKINPLSSLIINMVLTIFLIFAYFILGRKLDRKIFFISFSFFFLAFYIIVINFSYGLSLSDSLNLPLRIIFLYLIFFLTYQFIYDNKNSRFVFYFAIYFLAITAVFISIDLLNGVKYYTEHEINFGIGGNVKKFSVILLSIFPIFIYFNTKKYIVINFILQLITVRRSALISMLIIYIINYLFNFKFKINKILSLSIGLLIFIISCFFILNYTSLGELIIVRINDLNVISGEGTGSGRSVFWGLALSLFNSFEDVIKLFGNPTVLTNYLERFFGMKIGAHSDILDYLINYGIIGLILYLMIFISFFKFFINNITDNPVESKIGLSLLIGQLFFSSVTGGFYDSFNSITFVFLGYLIGKIEIEKKDKLNKILNFNN
jgi:hypothetical protein